VNPLLWIPVALLLPLGVFPVFTRVQTWLLGVERADAVAIFSISLGAAFLLMAWRLRRRIKGQVRNRSVKPPCQVLTLRLSRDLDKTVEVRSHSQPWLTYEVNLYRMTCTCPAFKMGKKRLKHKSLHRMCKHLRATALAEIGADLGVLRPILSDWQHGECYIKLAGDLIFSYAPGRNWIYVYAMSGQLGNGRSAYERFKYNLEREHWYYDNPPMEESRIMGLIRNYF
jgi:hypothetical protein